MKSLESTLFFPSYDVYNIAMNHDLQLAAAICQQVVLGGGIVIFQRANICICPCMQNDSSFFFFFFFLRRKD